MLHLTWPPLSVVPLCDRQALPWMTVALKLSLMPYVCISISDCALSKFATHLRACHII